MKKKIVIISTIITVGLAIIVAGAAIYFNLKHKTETKYEVYFESSGGSRVEAQYIKPNEKVQKPEDPTKIGLIFKGWYLNGQIYNFDLPVNNNLVLTAKWEADGTTTIYIVEFDSDGGTPVEPIEVSEGTAITEPKQPTKDNFVFAGWYYGEIKFDFSFVINENIKLTAKWIDANDKQAIQDNLKNQTTGANNQQTLVADSQNNQVNIEELYSKLSGRWYLENSELIYLETYGAIVGGQLNYFIWWNNIDLLGDFTKYPTYSLRSSSNLQEFVHIFKYNITDNKLYISKDGKNLTFSREKTIFDTSKYDVYLGTWYLPGYGENTKVIIEKENDNYFRITGYNFNVEKACYEEGNNSYPSALVVNEYSVYSKKDFFTEYNISYENGAVFIGNGANKKEFSRTPSTTIYNVTGISLEETTKTMQKNDTAYIKANIQPRNATNKSITWTSSNTNVAYVNSNGEITAWGVGKTNIIATTVDGNYQAICELTVTAIPAEGISLNKTSVNIKIGEGTYLEANIQPIEAASDATVTWESSDSSVATISQDGYVNPLKEGTTTIIAKCGNLKATCVVNVSRIEVTGITLPTNLNLKYGKSAQLTATVLPDNATNKKTIWSSSDANIVQVDANGRVTAQNIGNAIITAQTEDGNFKANCNINVSYEPIYINASIGYTVSMSGSSMFRGMEGSVSSVSGGTGKYTYYKLKLYYNGTLVAENIDTSLKYCRTPNSLSGEYMLEVLVRDSAGNEGTTTKTILYNTNF